MGRAHSSYIMEALWGTLGMLGMLGMLGVSVLPSFSEEAGQSVRRKSCRL